MRSIQLAFVVLTLIPNQASAQVEPGDVNEYVLRQSIRIDCKADHSNCVWQSIDTFLAATDILLLGEFTHGSATLSLVRNDMIRHLHENHDFDVILFESGIGELIQPDRMRDSYTPGQMTSGFFGAWQTDEFEGLMRYVQGSTIRIAGYDVQRTGSRFDEVLHRTCRNVNLPQKLYTNIEESYSECRRLLRQSEVDYREVHDPVVETITAYERLISRLEESGNPGAVDPIVLRTLVNRISYLKYMLEFAETRDWRARWTARDSVMADNIQWLLDECYSNEKVIVIGHNFHIAKHSERENVMGEFLGRQSAKSTLHIGMFAGRGTYRDNYGKLETMTAMDTSRLDIKRVVHMTGHRLSFLPLSRTDTSGAWLWEPIVVNDSFIDLNGSNTLVPGKHFDAVLLIESSKHPAR